MSNKIDHFIKSKETEILKYSPNNEFYQRIGINKKRWAQILRGQKDPTLAELTRLTNYFNVPASQLVDGI